MKNIKYCRLNKINDFIIYFKNIGKAISSEYSKSFEFKNEFIIDEIAFQETDNQKNYSDYENSIRKKFTDSHCTVFSRADNNEYSKGMDFSLDIFELMANKLTESQLIANVDYFTVTSIFEKGIIKHIVEFELKNAGYDWSFVFSKFISIKIQNKVLAINGKVNGQHFYNATQIRDYFIFSFTYKEIEIKNEVVKTTEVRNPVFHLYHHENI